MIASGRVRVDEMISAVVPLADAGAWFERLHRGEPGLMKVIVYRDPLSRMRLSTMTKTDRLIEAFGKQIAQGEYLPGSALPSEAELCARFETSRNVLREVDKVSTKRLIDYGACFSCTVRTTHFHRD